MEQPHKPRPRSQPRISAGRKRLFIAAVLTVAAGSAVVLVSWRGAPELRPLPLDTGSPYANTRPGVRPVGDAACARCHAEIARTFREHPMGRSLAPIASAPPAGAGLDDRHGRVLFEAHGREYSIEERAGRILHQEIRRDAAGRIIARNEAEVQFAVGSGRQGIAYLINRERFLFQSPITWYARERRWDLAPGYEKVDLHFDRTVTPDCLFCHANRVDAVAGTINRYESPIFRGHAIGCERCHGPGELHLRRPTVHDGRDITIVNPADLEPALRDAVCEQCHLIGHRRVLRLDRRAEDFRPGLPFHRFWTVLEPAGGPAEDRLVGQVEQMHESLCYRASGGRLGCISCHDPHHLPAREEEAPDYRGRCLECHAERGCRLPASARKERSPGREEDCAGCHMPRLRSSDILHAAVTNHRISRNGGGPDRGPSPAPAGDRPEAPGRLEIFHRELMDDTDRAAAGRDIGVALCRDGPQGAAVAAPLLESAVAARPDDTTAWESLGFALGQLGRGREALVAFSKALAREPNRESALAGAGYLAARGGRRDEAIASWRRAIAVSPWRSDYHAELAPLLFQARDWRGASESCRAALRLNPANLDVRRLLVRCQLRLQDPEAARAEFQTLLGFDPPDRDELIRWFAPHSRPR